jgi:hypothetical protein
MAALSGPRKIAKLDGPNFTPIFIPIKAAVIIYHGQMVGLVAGFVAPASITVAAVGVANLTYDDQNVTGQLSTIGSPTYNKIDNTNGADGARACVIEFGTFKFDNKAGDLVVAADLFASVYVEDDHTVRHTAASSVVAGKSMGIDPDGQVFVALGPGNQYARA